MLMVNENDDTLEARIVANTKTRHDNALRIILDEVIKLSEPSFSRGPRDESVQMAQFLILTLFFDVAEFIQTMDGSLQHQKYVIQVTRASEKTCSVYNRF